MGIVFFYTVLGGMKGITYTQVAQYCVLIMAYLVPAIFISIMVTGHILPQTGFGATLSDGSGMYLLEKLDGLSLELGFNEYTSGTKSMIDVFCITAALMVGTAGLPHVIVRFFTVPKVRDARYSAGWALIFIAILYTTAPSLASFARVNMIETINGTEQTGTDYANAPTWITNWEKTGLIAWDDKNNDGKMFYSGDDRNEVEMTNNKPAEVDSAAATPPAATSAITQAGKLAISGFANTMMSRSTSISLRSSPE
jgi:cation/acetate symporter